MIKSIDVSSLDSFCTLSQNVFTTRIFANATAYDGQDFCKTFLVQDEGKTLGAINLLGENACVWLEEKNEEILEETAEFLHFLGAAFVFTNEPKLIKREMQQGECLVFHKQVSTTAHFPFYPDYKKAYEICASAFDMPKYDEFLSDLSHRVPKKQATLSLFEDAVGITNWHYLDSCVISAVAVARDGQNRGTGSKMIQHILDGVDCKEIYVYCLETLTPFYEKNGFEKKGRYYAGKVE